MQIQQCLENESRVLIRMMIARLFFHSEQIGLYCRKTATKLQWLKISVYFLVIGSLLQDFLGSCLPWIASSFHAIFNVVVLQRLSRLPQLALHKKIDHEELWTSS